MIDYIVVKRVTNGKRCGKDCELWALNGFEESCCILQKNRSDGLEVDGKGNDMRCAECLAVRGARP